MNKPSVIITGASGGIGRAIALLYASEGWSVTLIGRNAKRLLAVENDCRNLGGEANIVVSDLTDNAAPAAVINAHMQQYGALAALVLCAGVGHTSAISDLTDEAIDEQIAVNLSAPIALARAALPILRKQCRIQPSRPGQIIAITSIVGAYTTVNHAVYAATKAAMISIVKSINAEEREYGIRASAVSPGYVHTAMTEEFTKVVPAKNMIQVDDVAKVVHLLMRLSPSAVIPHVIVSRTDAGAYRP